MQAERVLYIGNHLGEGGRYMSVAQTIEPWMRPEIEFRLVSRERNPVLRLMHMAGAVLRHVGGRRPVLIDTYSSTAFYYALTCGLFCRLFARPYICVLHGGALPGRLVSTPIRSQWLFSGARRLVAPSGYLQARFAERGYDSVVIPNPIRIGNYPFRFRNILRPKILWVRAFEATYNPQLAVRVLAALLPNYPDASLCMVGPDKDGSLEACKTLAEELGVADRVRFTGLLSKAEWIALSEDYDLFLNTTDVDNTPVSVIEAMALGLPVVSTNVGGIPYLIGDGQEGSLVEPRNTEAMRRAVDRLLKDPSHAREVTRRAREKAESFDWNRIKPLWLRLLGASQDGHPASDRPGA